MLSKIKDAGSTILGVAIFVGIIFVVGALLKGAVWISITILPWITTINAYGIIIAIVIILPLALVPKTRPIGAIGLFLISYLFGLTLWVWGCVLTYSIWGWIGLIIGLVIAGMGVVPIAILACAINGMWSMVGQLLILVVFTFGGRFLGIYLAEKTEETNRQLPAINSERKIGGFLIIFVISFALGIINYIWRLGSHILDIFSPEGYLFYLTKTSNIYEPVYFPLLTLDISSLLLGLLFTALLFYMLWKRVKVFPMAYLIMQAFCFIILLFYLFLAHNPNTLRYINFAPSVFYSSFVGIAIWVPYLFISRRVKETFVNETPSRLLKWLKSKVALVSIGAFFLITFGWILVTASNTHSTFRGKSLDEKVIADRALESSVVITMYNKKGSPISTGSGFFITKGIITTNYHVVENGFSGTARMIGRRIDYGLLQIIASDPDRDVALVSTDTNDGTPLELGDAEQLVVGEKIYAMGNPEGLEGTFSSGLVSNLLEDDTMKVIQITAPISHGSSGGPILNEFGQVVGIATAYLTKGQNINLAVPTQYILRLIANAENFYPLLDNVELNSNSSIQRMLTHSCHAFWDIDLPDKYFARLTKRELQIAKGNPDFEAAMPSAKAVWMLSDGMLMMGANPLEPKLLKRISKEQFNDSIKKLISDTTTLYKQDAPNASIKTGIDEVAPHLFRFSFVSEYTYRGEKSIDYRIIYFVLPFCRLDFLYSGKPENRDVDVVLLDILDQEIVKALPGSYKGESDKLPFKFKR